MKIYHWQCVETFEQYAAGDIIVVAASLEDAKKIALDKGMIWARSDAGLMLDYINSYDPEEHAETLTKTLKRLKEDLAKDPTVIPITEAICIRGGE